MTEWIGSPEHRCYLELESRLRGETLLFGNLRRRFQEWRIRRAERRGELTCDPVVRLQLLRAERTER